MLEGEVMVVCRTADSKAIEAMLPRVIKEYEGALKSKIQVKMSPQRLPESWQLS